MSTLSRSSRIQISGFAGGIGSVALLYVGMVAAGGGHGSYVLWYAGLVAAALSGLSLLVGTASAAWKKETKGLIYGLLAIAVFVAVGIYFFDITEWLSGMLS